MINRIILIFGGGGTLCSRKANTGIDSMIWILRLKNDNLIVVEGWLEAC